MMPNPTGKNQYINCPQPGDEVVAKALQDYHDRGITSVPKIRQLLLADYGIKMQDRTIFQRRKILGIKASGATTRSLPDTVKRQLVLDELREDPGGQLGPRMIKKRILERTGIHLTRDYVASEMRLHVPEGFILRAQTSRFARVQVAPENPNDRRSDADESKSVTPESPSPLPSVSS
ncbi:hypothetical protein HYPSUDRAFT_191733 [Hypholoma sublateritium FD-334 SS-4]|uniref:Uncharacterized protein n=1 Tax=Hypholoma sublateritium (strain FD-334 SS-4) TaxID=945553 RepID=A0A0D2KSZ7_HYPSF|nr:hypothetical protein HYPSUDRAFT_191733 [Hypholoma sublateritium FD-334 SS-4]